MLEGERFSFAASVACMVAGVDGLSFSPCGRYLAATSTCGTQALFIVDLNSKVKIITVDAAMEKILDAESYIAYSESVDLKKALKNLELPAKDGEGPAKDVEVLTKDGEVPAKDGEVLAKDGEGPSKDGESPAKDGEGPDKDEEGPSKDGEGLAKDGEGRSKDGEGPIKIEEGHQKSVNGKRIIDQDKHMRVMTNCSRRLDGHKGAVQGGRFSPDGTRLISWCSGYKNPYQYDTEPTGVSELILWDTSDWHIITRVEPEYMDCIPARIGYEMGQGFTSVCYIPNTDYVASCSLQGRLHLRDASDLKQISDTQAHSAYIPTIKATSCGRFVITASHDMTLKIWGVPMTEPVAHYSLGGAAMGLGVFTLPSGNLMINVGDTRARLDVFEVETKGRDPPKKKKKQQDANGCAQM